MKQNEDLIDLAGENHVSLPESMNILAELPPYAVEFRYAFILDSLHEPEYYLVHVREFIKFVENILK